MMKSQRAKNPSSGGRLLPLGGFLRPRGGLTLIEILMTIFVLAIGLLGVAALLPVGSYQMQRGQVAQRVAEIGSRALDTIEASGMHDPGRWLKHEASTGEFYPFDAIETDPDRRIAFPVDPNETNDLTTIGTTTTAATKLGSGDFAGSLLEFARGQNRLWGEQATIDSVSGQEFTLRGALPTAPLEGDVFTVRRNEPFAIDPLFVARQYVNSTTTEVPDLAAGVARLTLSDEVGTAMGQVAAEALFVAADDQRYTEPEDESKLPEQDMLLSAAGARLRAYRGDYSWLATFAPAESVGSYRDGRSYTVSVAVFYKRPLQLALSASQRTLDLTHNGGSTFSILGTTFEDNDGNGTYEQEAGDESYIKRGQWGLVTFEQNGLQRARWYRLGSVGKPADTVDNPVKARLIGPDFPSSGVANSQITFYEGLEAVFERTMPVKQLPLGAAQ